MPRLEAGKMRLDAVDRDRKAADPVAVGADEIGEAHIGAAFALGDLLAQEGDADVPFLFDKVDDDIVALAPARPQPRSDEHTSELQSLIRLPYAVFCLQ